MAAMTTAMMRTPMMMRTSSCKKSALSSSNRLVSHIQTRLITSSRRQSVVVVRAEAVTGENSKNEWISFSLWIKDTFVTSFNAHIF